MREGLDKVSHLHSECFRHHTTQARKDILQQIEQLKVDTLWSEIVMLS